MTSTPDQIELYEDNEKPQAACETKSDSDKSDQQPDRACRLVIPLLGVIFVLFGAVGFLGYSGLKLKQEIAD